MEWLKRMNDALEYMERNLSEEISLETAAKLACSSVYHFQRMFSYIVGVPLSEYIRRRRLTKAAFDLQRGEKVLDVALRYGYDSPTAFNRAFQAVHGLAPSSARKLGAVLMAYPRISFQIKLKGEEKMEYRIEKKEAFRIVGVREPIKLDLSYKARDDMEIDDAKIRDAFGRTPMFWQEAGQSGKIAEICTLMNREPMGLLGITDCKDGEEQSYYYIAAATDKSAPDGMFDATIPECTWAIFPDSGAPASIQGLMERIYSEWLPASGYEWAEAPDIEVYLDDNPVNMHYEVWLPVKDGKCEFCIPL